MRYLRLIIAAIFMILCILFAYQNTETVAIHFRIDWINFSISSGTLPIFLPILIAVAFGMIFTTAYFFVVHSILKVQMTSQKSEIFRLKKLVLLEREKQKGGDSKNPSQIDEQPEGDTPKQPEIAEAT